MGAWVGLRLSCVMFAFRIRGRWEVGWGRFGGVSGWERGWAGEGTPQGLKPLLEPVCDVRAEARTLRPCSDAGMNLRLLFERVRSHAFEVRGICYPTLGTMELCQGWGALFCGDAGENRSRSFGCAQDDRIFFLLGYKRLSGVGDLLI